MQVEWLLELHCERDLGFKPPQLGITRGVAARFRRRLGEVEPALADRHDLSARGDLAQRLHSAGHAVRAVDAALGANKRGSPEGMDPRAR